MDLAQRNFMQKLLVDSLGFAGAKMIRRVVGAGALQGFVSSCCGCSEDQIVIAMVIVGASFLNISVLQGLWLMECQTREHC